ncbi:Arm DNA-binding domain-containing protein [Fictibacillus sp. 23RED33]|uniref:Arm DNA-binding domain-containing protein n=1 Tax=Fictibacillus sp. 23RED33 TaxID=2745879 RepID=UPI0018CE0C60|nr:Arm DNA-binding domain-containing protein [Fictibacillus sp. 23RED33]MBH0175939.1 Arm DNA-binding domain-containing protein [Fictibacillus sp. 23RED33]
MPVIKKVNGLYGFVVDVGTKGKRKQKRVSGFKKKSDAEKALAEIIAAKHSGTYHEPSKLTVKDYFNDWLLNKRNLKNTTFTVYKSLIEKHIIPEVGHLSMVDLKEQHIQKMFRKFDEVIPKERKLKKEIIYEKRLSNKTQSAI